MILSLLSTTHAGLSGGKTDGGRTVGYLGGAHDASSNNNSSIMHSSLTRWLLALIAMRVQTQLQKKTPRNLKVRQESKLSPRLLLMLMPRLNVFTKVSITLVPNRPKAILDNLLFKSCMM